MKDTALTCFYSLTRLRNEEDKSLNINFESKRFKRLLGSKNKQNQVPSYWWKRLNVVRLKKEKLSDEIKCLQFSSLSTGGAREEQRELYSSTPIVENLIEDLSKHNRWTPQLAKTIFELLIPNDFKEQVKAQSNINWIL